MNEAQDSTVHVIVLTLQMLKHNSHGSGCDNKWQDKIILWNEKRSGETNMDNVGSICIFKVYCFILLLSSSIFVQKIEEQKSNKERLVWMADSGLFIIFSLSLWWHGVRVDNQLQTGRRLCSWPLQAADWASLGSSWRAFRYQWGSSSKQSSSFVVKSHYDDNCWHVVGRYNKCRNILRTFWKNCTKKYERISISGCSLSVDGICLELPEAVKIVSAATPISVTHGAGAQNLWSHRPWRWCSPFLKAANRECASITGMSHCSGPNSFPHAAEKAPLPRWL